MNATVYMVNILKDHLDIANIVSSIIYTIITAIVLLIAYFQFKALVKDNGLKTVLYIEAELSQRRSKMSELSTKLCELPVSNEYELSQIPNDVLNMKFRETVVSKQQKLSEIYESELKSAIESYLNAIDRLCYCFLNGYVLEKGRDKSEYHDLLKSTVRTHESKFKSGTKYRNIIELLNKWNDE